MKTFGFCKIETRKCDMAKGSLLILDEEPRADYINHRIGVFVEVCDHIDMSDFNKWLDIPIKSTTDSYQIRPKVVHLNNKGYYVKEKTGVSYLEPRDIERMERLFKFRVL